MEWKFFFSKRNTINKSPINEKHWQSYNLKEEEKAQKQVKHCVKLIFVKNERGNRDTLLIYLCTANFWQSSSFKKKKKRKDIRSIIYSTIRNEHVLCTSPATIVKDYIYQLGLLNLYNIFLSIQTFMPTCTYMESWEEKNLYLYIGRWPTLLKLSLRIINNYYVYKVVLNLFFVE